ncbi:MAG: hypothetical protein QM784_12450 [Polyangiaceae bacterium]
MQPEGDQQVMCRALVLVAVVGCYRPSTQLCAESGCVDGGDDTDDGMVNDGPLPDDPPGQFCIGTLPIRPCFAAEPTGTLNLTGFNSDNVACPFELELAGRLTCVIAARDIVVPSVTKPHFSGQKPVVIVGVFSIHIEANAILDLSSTVQVTPREGAGSQPAACGVGAPGMPNNNQDGAGGGAFATDGSDGGKGAGGMSLEGGIANPIAFRGGCRGADGELNNKGGPGGGAVYLISNSIQIDGAIRATGGGGLGGPESGGGAGGGAGGYIGIDAPTVTYGANGLLVATGGGGGGGGCMGEVGTAGRDADTSSNISAIGGPGIAGSGDGGDGASTRDSPGGNGEDNAAATCAGGGGGGGLGTIQYFHGVTCPAARCHPAAVTNP